MGNGGQAFLFPQNINISNIMNISRVLSTSFSKDINIINIFLVWSSFLPPPTPNPQNINIIDIINISLVQGH